MVESLLDVSIGIALLALSMAVPAGFGFVSV